MKRLSFIFLFTVLIPIYASVIERSEVQLARAAVRKHGGDVEWYLLVTQALQEAGLKDIEIFYRLFNRWNYVFDGSQQQEVWIDNLKTDEGLSPKQRDFLMNNMSLFEFVGNINDSDSFTSYDIHRLFGSELEYTYKRDFRPYTLRFIATLGDVDWLKQVRSKITETTGADLLEISDEIYFKV